MGRLRDGQVKFGAARHEHFSGGQRRMVNHITIGTTHLNVLDRGSDHLYVCVCVCVCVRVCVVCKDDNLRTTNPEER
jgi:hypothetical protein